MSQIIHVLVRILSVMLLIASCGVLMYFSHEQLKVSLINQQDPIAAVPEDAGVIIESNKMKSALVNMSETNLIWSKLLEHQAFQEFDNNIKLLDAFFVKDKIVDETLVNKKVIVSFHPGDKQAEMFVATNASNDFYQSILSLLKKEGFNYKQTEKAIIECFDQSRKKFFLTYKEPFFMYSSSIMLIEQALLQLDKGNGLHKNKGFCEVHTTKSTSSDLHVFLQSNQLKRIAGNYLNNNTIQNWQEGAYFNGWLALDFNVKPNSMQISGLSLLKDPGIFDQAINRQLPIAKKKYKLLPGNVNFLRSYSISNISDFIMDHTFISPSTLDETCQCNSADLLGGLIGDELIYAEIKIRERSQKIMIFKKADDYKSARSSLQLLGNGDSLMNVVGNNQIYRLNSNLFTQVLGIKLGEADLYYQELGDHVILSSMEGIRIINKAWKKNKQNNDFTNFSYYSNNYLTNFSSVDYYWEKNEFFSHFKGSFKNEYQDNVQRLSNVLSDIDGISFQASSSSNYNFHSYAISTGNSTVEASSQLWVADIDSISRVPELMKNHRTNTLELLVQDENNVIYLISATGKVKWSKQLEGQIIGEVKQMDFYKNAKWQMLFNTGSKIHLLDINGNEVSGFPFQLKSLATNSVNVFDYENKGNYRFLVCAEDKKVYNFDKTGKSLPDWKYPSSKSIVNSPIEHIVVKQKDYLFSYDMSGHVYLYDRRGNIRYNSSILCKPNKLQNFKLKKDVDIENSSITFIDSLNNVIQSRFNAGSDTLINAKKDFSITDFSSKEEKFYVNFFYLGNDQLMYYSVSNGHNIAIYGPDKELQFIEYLDFVVGDNVQVLGYKERYVLISNEKEKEIYLYDSDYNPTNVFSVPGSASSIVGDMNFDGVDEVITITEDGKIIAYSVDANFN